MYAHAVINHSVSCTVQQYKALGWYYGCWCPIAGGYWQWFGEIYVAMADVCLGSQTAIATNTGGGDAVQSWRRIWSMYGYDNVSVFGPCPDKAEGCDPEVEAIAKKYLKPAAR